MPRSRRKRMTSILPDSLDPIEEVTNEDDSSNVDLSPPPAPRKPLVEASPTSVDSGSRQRSIQLSPEECNLRKSIDKSSLPPPPPPPPSDDKRQHETHGRKRRPRRGSSGDNLSVSDHRPPAERPPEVQRSHSERQSARSSDASTTNHSDRSNASTESTAVSSQEDDDGSNRSTRSLEVADPIEEPLSPRKHLYDYDQAYTTTNGDNSQSTLKSNISDADDSESPAWRLTPEESMSDWTLRVKNRDTGAVKTYHLHKNFLCVGKRRSEYCLQVLATASGDPPLTEIILYDAAVHQIPNVLDYIYCKRLRLHADTAVPLRFLAQFLGIKVLFKKVMDFIGTNLSLATITSYLRDATLLKDEKLLGMAARHVARNILHVTPLHPLLQTASLDIWGRVLSSPGIVSDERRLHASLLTAAILKIHQDELTIPVLQQLTDETVVPLVHPQAALVFLELEADVVLATTLMPEVTSLQQRCIRVLAQVDDLRHAETARVCRKLPARVVTELLMATLGNAQPEEPTPQVQDQIADLQAQLSRSQAALHAAQSELAKYHALPATAKLSGWKSSSNHAQWHDKKDNQKYDVFYYK